MRQTAFESENSNAPLVCPVAVVGAGPAGLMAAEVLSAAGVQVHVFDAMPTAGRKFLLAGIGGLNLTHAEAPERFVTRYAACAAECGRWLQVMGPQAVRDWASGLGVETFVGSSQRVFPTNMKAAPLLRAWLQRLRHPVQAGAVPVIFHMRHRWSGGWQASTDAAALPQKLIHALTFDTPHGPQVAQAEAVVLALGGGSWPRLGSDGAWQSWLQQQGVVVRALRPANCGFEVKVQDRRGWSEYLASRCAGQPLKGVVLRCIGPDGTVFERKGECVLTATGLEGSLVYAASALLREAIECCGCATLELNLKPDWSAERLLAELQRPRHGRSLSSVLKSRVGLTQVQTGLLHELLDKAVLHDPLRLTQAIQALSITLAGPRPLDEAISSAGGVVLEALTEGLMLKTAPGVFCAGEMLDWEAPTGGYLLTACLASGRVAGQGVLRYQSARETPAFIPGRDGAGCTASP